MELLRLLYAICFLFSVYSAEAASSISPRIAYGSNAKPGQIPFAVNFRIDREMCGGSIFAPRVIISAAHCVVDMSGKVQPVGEYNSTVNVGSTNKDNATEMVMANAFIPSAYTHQAPYFGDISLIELKEPVPRSISKIALASKDTYIKNGTQLTVSGWGLMENQMFAKDLKFTSMAIETQAFCKNAFKQTWNGSVLPPDHFCVVANPVTHASTCPGDSGGAYFVEREGKAPIQIGINSMSTPGAVCGAKDIQYKFPTAVKFWRQWIEDTMSVQNLRGTKPPARLNSVADAATCYKDDGKNGVAQIRTQSLGRCCDSCRSNTACKAWTWRGDTELCTMFSNKIVGPKSSKCTSGWF